MRAINVRTDHHQCDFVVGRARQDGCIRRPKALVVRLRAQYFFSEGLPLGDCVVCRRAPNRTKEFKCVVDEHWEPRGEKAWQSSLAICSSN